MALIPGSFKTTQQEGKRLISSAGRVLLTPQNPAEEDPICCCEVPVVGNCELCESTAAVCQTNLVPPNREFMRVDYAMVGSDAAQSVQNLRFEGNMHLIYNGANCQWRDPDITEFGTDNSFYVNSGTIHYDDEPPGGCSFVNNYFYDGILGVDNTGCGGQVDGVGGHFGNWTTILACVEVTGAAHKDILNAIGGPGLAWELRMFCLDFFIDCGVDGTRTITWNAFAYAPFDENAPATCYGITGPYTSVPSVAPPLAMDYEIITISNATEP